LGEGGFALESALILPYQTKQPIKHQFANMFSFAR